MTYFILFLKQEFIHYGLLNPKRDQSINYWMKNEIEDHENTLTTTHTQFFSRKNEWIRGLGEKTFLFYFNSIYFVLRQKFVINYNKLTCTFLYSRYSATRSIFYRFIYLQKTIKNLINSKEKDYSFFIFFILLGKLVLVNSLKERQYTS